MSGAASPADTTCELWGTRWVVNDAGQAHSENNPAITYANGTHEWWYAGQLHRLGGPARTTATGVAEYHIHGLRYHREEEYWKKVEELQAGCAA